jgi:ribosomal protein S18 acetylase RimI-like enzyme
VELRAAQESDFEAIIRLIPSQKELFYVYPSGRFPFTMEQLRTIAAARTELTLAVEDGDVIGFANLYNLDPGKSVFIGNLVVAGEQRGRGVGRRLLSHMIQRGFVRYGVEEVRLSVFNDNTAALLLYADMQFQPYAIEQRSDPSGNRVGLIHMRLQRTLWIPSSE